jgi:hypothetical protein
MTRSGETVIFYSSRRQSHNWQYSMHPFLASKSDAINVNNARPHVFEVVASVSTL